MEAVLERLRLRMLERKYPLEPPCLEDEIQKLVKNAYSEFGVRLPESSLNFLRVTNGLDDNALSIFGSHQRKSAAAVTTKSDWLILGFVEENRYYRDNREDYDQFLIFACREGRLYAQVIATGEFIKLRETDDAILEVYESFEKMIIAAMESALNE